MNGLYSFYILELKSRPCEKFLADFFTTAFLKALEINLLWLSTLKIADGQTLRSVEMQKSTREFYHREDVKKNSDIESIP